MYPDACKAKEEGQKQAEISFDYANSGEDSRRPYENLANLGKNQEVDYYVCSVAEHVRAKPGQMPDLRRAGIQIFQSRLIYLDRFILQPFRRREPSKALFSAGIPP